MNVITPGTGLGPIAIGATFAELEAALGAPATADDDDMAELTFPTHGVLATLFEGKVCNIAFKHASWEEGFTTPTVTSDKGIALGTSTEADILAAYGAPMRVYEDSPLRALHYPGISFTIYGAPPELVEIEVTEIEDEPAPRKKKSKAATLVKKDLAWFDENHENINSRAFEKVWFGDGNVKLSGAAIAKLLNYETEAAIVVEGDLVIDGDLRIDDHHSVQVTGDVSCRAFLVGAGVFACDTLKASKCVEFAADETQRLETFDVRSIVTAKIVSPHHPRPLAPTVKLTKSKPEKARPKAKKAKRVAKAKVAKAKGAKANVAKAKTRSKPAKRAAKKSSKTRR